MLEHMLFFHFSDTPNIALSDQPAAQGNPARADTTAPQPLSKWRSPESSAVGSLFRCLFQLPTLPFSTAHLQTALPDERMDAVSDDPETIEDFKEIAETLHMPAETVAIIFFVVFIVVCMAISLGCWYMHHRYAQAQKRATLPSLEKGSKSKTPSPQMSMAKHWRNASTTSSTQGLLPNRPKPAVLPSRSALGHMGPTNSSVTLVDPSVGPTFPKEAVFCRASKTYSLTLLDLYASPDEDPQPQTGMSTSRSQTL
ncbi:hypothetical protein FRC01_012438 [Tulasnella sp. 417]|nr:hypothetical protein FRC01_012438 [Tulasnella sp. 417]